MPKELLKYLQKWSKDYKDHWLLRVDVDSETMIQPSSPVTSPRNIGR